MRNRDAADTPGHSSPLAELLLADRLSPGLRAVLALLALGVAVGWGFAALALHGNEVAARATGDALSPIGTLFADASTPITSWPGWVVAALLGPSALRLRRAAVEPPAGRGSAEELTAGQLRAGLRREYRAARLALVAIAVLTLADLARLGVSGLAALLSVSGAGDGLGWMGVEVGGLVAATASLGFWVLAFRDQLDRAGALPRR